MKFKYVFILVMSLSGNIYSDDTNELTATRDPMPDGMAGCYSTQKATVDKVFAANQDGARFRAYQVKWMNQDVIISDTLGTTDYKEGDTIKFMAQNIELPIRDEKIKTLQFMIMDFSRFMPKETKSRTNATAQGSSVTPAAAAPVAPQEPLR